ncbi:MAG: hypothetical protein ABIJ34_05820 [archaeon]
MMNTAPVIKTIEEIASLYPRTRRITAISAFPTPNYTSLHMGHLRGFMLQRGILNLFDAMGYETFFPFGLHPTGKDTFNLVVAVQNDLRNDGINRQITLESSKYGFSSDTLADLVRFQHKKFRNVDLTKASPHDAAHTIVAYLGQEYMDLLSRFNIESADFKSSFMTTIDPIFTTLTTWTINELHSRGYIAEVTEMQPYCRTCDDFKDVTNDKLEVDFSGDTIKANRNQTGDVIGYDKPLSCKADGTPLVMRQGTSVKMIYQHNELPRRTVAMLEDMIAVGRMQITVPDLNQLEDVIETRVNKNLERKTSAHLGALSPITPERVIEPLADSNLYWLMYSIIQYIHDSAKSVGITFQQEHFNATLFEYIFRSEEQLLNENLTPQSVLDSYVPKVKRTVTSSKIYKLRQKIQTENPPVINIMGMEHLWVHLVYSAMFHKALDLDHLFPEGIISYGMVRKLAPVYREEEISESPIAKPVFAEKGEKIYVLHEDGSHSTMIAKGGEPRLDFQKMSKSKGNMVTTIQALNQTKGWINGFGKHYNLDPEKFAADAISLYMIGTVNPLDPLDWSNVAWKAQVERLKRLYSNFVDSILPSIKNTKISDKDRIDLWLESRIKARIDSITSHIFTHDFRYAAEELVASTEMQYDLQRYITMKDGLKLNRDIIASYIGTYTALLSIFMPYVSDRMAEAARIDKLDLLDQMVARNASLEQEVSLLERFAKFEDIPVTTYEKMEKEYWVPYFDQLFSDFRAELMKGTKGGKITPTEIIVAVASQNEQQILTKGLSIYLTKDMIKYIPQLSRMTKGPIGETKVEFKVDNDQIPGTYQIIINA